MPLPGSGGGGGDGGNGGRRWHHPVLMPDVYGIISAEDWRVAAREAIDCAMFRATWGEPNHNGFLDGSYASNAVTLKNLFDTNKGLPFGVFHFLTGIDPSGQADYFWNRVQAVAARPAFLAVDWEQPTTFPEPIATFNDVITFIQHLAALMRADHQAFPLAIYASSSPPGGTWPTTTDLGVKCSAIVAQWQDHLDRPEGIPTAAWQFTNSVIDETNLLKNPGVVPGLGPHDCSMVLTPHLLGMDFSGDMDSGTNFSKWRNIDNPNNFYQNPFRDANISPARIDGGVDYCGTGPVYFLGKAKVIHRGTPSNTSTFGSDLTIYQLLEGPAKGKYVFFGEHYNVVNRSTGDIVTSNDIMGTMTGCIEIGWGDSDGSMAWGIDNGIEGELTAWGLNFNQLLVALGCISGTFSGRPTTMSLPPGWPQWVGSANGAPGVFSGGNPGYGGGGMAGYSALTATDFYKFSLKGSGKHFRIDHDIIDIAHSDYYSMLFDSHTINIEIKLYDQDEKLIGHLPKRYGLTAGQVDVDLTSDVPRQLSLDLAVEHPGDFKAEVWGESGGGDAFAAGIEKGPFHPARFIEVVYNVLVNRPKGADFPSGMPAHGTLNTWVSQTVFYGVPTNIQADQQNSTLHIEAQSKEMLLQAPNAHRWTMRRPLQLPGKNDLESAHARLGKNNKYGQKGNTLGNVIRFMAQQYGETKFNVDHAGDRIDLTAVPAFLQRLYPNDIVLPPKKGFPSRGGRGALADATRNFIRDKGLWEYLQAFANGFGYHLYYDMEGYLTLTHKQFYGTSDHQSVVAVLTNHPVDKTENNSNPPSCLATMPAVAFDEGAWRNECVVMGVGALANSSLVNAPMAVIYEDPNEQGSAQDLERNGMERAMTMTVTVPGFSNKNRAKLYGRRALSNAIAQAEQITVDSLPIPHVDLYQPVGVRLSEPDGSDSQHNTILVPQKWTLPLVPNQLMSWGFNAPMRVVTKGTTPRRVYVEGT